MSGSVTICTKRNEILICIITELSARPNVVDLEISRRAAILAAPPVACEHLSGRLAIGVGFKAQSWPFPFELIQGCSSPSRATRAASPREERRCFVPKISLCRDFYDVFGPIGQWIGEIDIAPSNA